MSIDAGAQVAIILLACRPCVVIVDYWDMLYLGRAPHTKETLSDFREWCRVTRHLQVFRGLLTDPRVLGHHIENTKKKNNEDCRNISRIMAKYDVIKKYEIEKKK